jgi:AraC-like DNA-binding protein
MQTRKHFPRPPLAAFVRCFWYAEGTPQKHSREKLLPNGEPSVIFNLRDDKIRLYDPRNLGLQTNYAGSVLSGARSDCFVIDTDQQERVAGIQFGPGGAFPFFRVPASETEGITVDLDRLWGARTSELREQLLAARTVESMFADLERFLMRQLVRPPELHPAVTYALGHFQRPGYTGRVDTVIGKIGLSPRRFIELFHREVGLTPKVFCRVRRFQHVLQTVRDQRKEIDWAQVAVECGYYDQAHFIHDFQSFSGLTPNRYLATATPHLNHIPLI